MNFKWEIKLKQNFSLAINNANQDKVFHLFLLLTDATWKYTIQDKLCLFPWESLVILKIHSFKISTSLALFDPIYSIEVVTIEGRQTIFTTLPFRKLQIEKLNIKYAV